MSVISIIAAKALYVGLFSYSETYAVVLLGQGWPDHFSTFAYLLFIIITIKQDNKGMIHSGLSLHAT